MEPIINPIWIYITNIVEELKYAIGIAAGLVITIAVICTVMLIAGLLCVDDTESNNCILFYKKWSKKLFIIGSILCIVCGSIPSRNTVYKMIVVSQITPDNIEMVGNDVIDVIDYITDKIEEITGEDDDFKE